eukprot:CAMPEP_0175881140 /NCGR_PEP_ID=MMETSP0107_2-20121207/42713_1 /TAXON_ID=195067 ORGANISM="Goniomonas pacifica, Strain CCMP1869" /NCGR_SAMPLE_ID=MMETSP0107_2 /ASSEMBLY_ACC=CAM_ASM_000203 /LENGTH=97 /DNA_ID=CAMNT_0017200973 /DNA_START=131 /DNA_END=423 /DNA_ORIENTATION=+
MTSVTANMPMPISDRSGVMSSERSGVPKGTRDLGLVALSVTSALSLFTVSGRSSAGGGGASMILALATPALLGALQSKVEAFTVALLAVGLDAPAAP